MDLASLKKTWRPRLSLSVVVPIAVGFIVCLEARSFFRKPVPSIEAPRYLVARTPVAAGQPITAIEFTLVHSLPGAARPPGALTDQDLHQLKGATTRVPIAAGEFLDRARVRIPTPGGHLGAAVPRGQRAYTLRADGAPDARAGDRIDIFLPPDAAHESPVTLAEGALVLRAAGEEDPTLVVAVSQGEIQILERARRQGGLRITLRNPLDTVSNRARGEGLQVRRQRRPIRILTERDRE